MPRDPWQRPVMPFGEPEPELVVQVVAELALEVVQEREAEQEQEVGEREVVAGWEGVAVQWSVQEW